ncbi:MAG: MdsD protein [Planctomycetes bacterium]|nr:MdsD protein [Planctomycetota bacterium]
MLRFISFCLFLIPGFAFGQESILFPRTPDISPDAKTVVFSYLGDIWTVDATGGNARPLTIHTAHDFQPAFSPDGKFIAFSSNRHGSYDCFIIPAQGGKSKRLTFDSANDIVCGWSPDSKSVLFSSNRGLGYPGFSNLYLVSIEGGQPIRITFDEAKDGTINPAGNLIAYTRGPGAWYRKGYRGSSNDDLWIANLDGTNNKKITDFNGQDSSPMWGQNGNAIYYVSEAFGNPSNIVRVENKAGAKPVKITNHTSEGVRKARISANGASIVYECGPDICIVDTADPNNSRKIKIKALADDKTNTDRLVTFTQNASEFAFNKEESLVIFGVHGDLYRMGISGSGKPVRLTDTPADDLSDRTGRVEVFLLESADAEHPKFIEAHQFKAKQITNDEKPESSLTFSPDGKKIYFLRAGKLWSMNLDGAEQKEVVSISMITEYSWSPDGKWIVYSRRDGSFASELFIIPAAGPTKENPPKNITRYATANYSPTWSTDGKRIAFVSERRNTPGLFVMEMQKPVANSKTMLDSGAIDFDEIHSRVNAVGTMNTTDAAISPSGSKIAFRSGDELWVASVAGGQVTKLSTGLVKPQGIYWSKRTTDLIYFRDGNGSLRTARASSTLPGADLGSVSFRIKMMIKAEEENLEIFDQCWRLLADNFYDAKFHGADWGMVRQRYRPMVSHVPMKEDFQALVFLMLGELNASHLGLQMTSGFPDEQTADLGILFDESFRGRGLKIGEVIKRGPADKRGLDLKPGEIIFAINGVELNPMVEVSQLLNGKIDEAVVLSVGPETPSDPKAKNRRSVEITPILRDRMVPLLYDRWVNLNAKKVAEMSNGRVGYIHIPSMDDAGLDRFVRALYSDNFDKEALVLDVRFNGGGFTHDQVLNYLGAQEHTKFLHREGDKGAVLRSYDRKWTKPVVLLINNRSYSDAEIFPNAFKTLGLGRLVGQPTGGMVIGTGSAKLIDGSTFRIPRIGVYTNAGVDMDTVGVAPDYFVEPMPEDLKKGIDAQLQKAVDVILTDMKSGNLKNREKK